MSLLTKLFFFLIGLALFAAACAWIMGGESFKDQTRISINASPRSVFRYLTEGEKIRQWASDIVSVGDFSADTGFSQERIVTDPDGKELRWEDSVMRFQPPNAISIQSKNGGLTNTLVFQLEENDLGGTNLEYRVTRKASGMEQFLFSLQQNEAIGPKMAAEMTRLKDLVEREVEAESPAGSEATENEAPLVASTAEGNNGSTTSRVDGSPVAESGTPPAKSTKPSIIDRVLGPVGGEPEDENKIPDGQRNFESLFATGG